MITIHTGDALDQLRAMPDNSVHCVVTSPPYYGLRDYGVEGQMGLEATPVEFVERLVTVFREVRRVLAIDGTVWLNMGDSYATGRSGARDASRWPRQSRNDHKPLLTMSYDGLKPKDLIGMPWRVAFAMQNDGWWLRQDIIWHKPNPMPESVRDRCAKAHEYIFLLSKSDRYFFDADAIREPLAAKTYSTFGSSFRSKGTDDLRKIAAHNWAATVQERRPKLGTDGEPAGALKRSVWTVATQPFRGAHFATFPPRLIEPCIQAGTSERGHCPACGARWVRETTRTNQVDPSARGSKFDSGKTASRNGGDRTQAGDRFLSAATGRWLPTCTHDLAPVPDIVLDPFAGAGTTLMVAAQLFRDGVGIEINPAYAEMARQRVRDEGGLGQFLEGGR